MMELKEMLDRLSALVMIDHDAVLAYERVLDEIDDASLRNTLASFKSNHQYHITDLSNVIMQKGGEPPELKRDVGGVFLESVSGISGVMGRQGALGALESGEQYTNERYQYEVERDYPEDVMQVLQLNYGDERRHLRYVRQALEKAA